MAPDFIEIVFVYVFYNIYNNTKVDFIWYFHIKLWIFLDFLRKPIPKIIWNDVYVWN